jgi:hypothetical protein
MKTLKITLLLILFGIYAVSLTFFLLSLPDNEPDPFRTPYSVKILGDHEVQLSSKNDTISLFLENSGIFNNEETVFIKHK